jgi:hypothetical protein
MRDALNAILSFIGVESLTDEEFDSIDLDTMDDQVAVYEELKIVLEDRELGSAMTTRLQNYFLAKGTSVVSPSSPDSNIWVGSSLE